MNEIETLIAGGETITTEFKSDLKSLPDKDLIATVVAMANTEGGSVLLGVEDDGEITGLHSKHMDTAGIPALIGNKTNPALIVEVNQVVQKGKPIAHIKVPKCQQLIATTEGLIVRRKLLVDGKPESAPFYPHEFTQRQSSLGLIDYSAMPVTGVTPEQLSPIVIGQKKGTRYQIKN